MFSSSFRIKMSHITRLIIEIKNIWGWFMLLLELNKINGSEKHPHAIPPFADFYELGWKKEFRWTCKLQKNQYLLMQSLMCLWVSVSTSSSSYCIPVLQLRSWAISASAVEPGKWNKRLIGDAQISAPQRVDSSPGSLCEDGQLHRHTRASTHTLEQICSHKTRALKCCIYFIGKCKTVHEKCLTVRHKKKKLECENATSIVYIIISFLLLLFFKICIFGLFIPVMCRSGTKGG